MTQYIEIWHNGGHLSCMLKARFLESRKKMLTLVNCWLTQKPLNFYKKISKWCEKIMIGILRIRPSPKAWLTWCVVFKHFFSTCSYFMAVVLPKLWNITVSFPTHLLSQVVCCGLSKLSFPVIYNFVWSKISSVSLAVLASNSKGNCEEV